jgi:hypothetical protein
VWKSRLGAKMFENEVRAGTKLQAASAYPPGTAKAPASVGISEGGEVHEPEEHGVEHEHALDWQEMARIVFVAVAAGTAWFLGPQLSLSVVIAGAICTLG